MKLNTLASLLDVLIKEDKEVILSEDVINGALVPLDRMLELGK
jgi:quinolinate synthase